LSSNIISESGELLRKIRAKRSPNYLRVLHWTKVRNFSFVTPTEKKPSLETGLSVLRANVREPARTGWERRIAERTANKQGGADIHRCLKGVLNPYWVGFSI
jgi:hypothetical protein